MPSIFIESNLKVVTKGNRICSNCIPGSVSVASAAPRAHAWRHLHRPSWDGKFMNLTHHSLSHISWLPKLDHTYCMSRPFSSHMGHSGLKPCWLHSSSLAKISKQENNSGYTRTSAERSKCQSENSQYAASMRCWNSAAQVSVGHGILHLKSLVQRLVSGPLLLLEEKHQIQIPLPPFIFFFY